MVLFCVFVDVCLSCYGLVRGAVRGNVAPDPATWTRPWTVSVPIMKLEAKVPRIFEYDCHEGNYGMTGLLSGARAGERARGLR